MLCALFVCAVAVPREENEANGNGKRRSRRVAGRIGEWEGSQVCVYS